MAPDLYTDDQIAEAIHALNGLLQKWAGEIGQPDWEKIPPEMHQRLLNLVRGYRNGITPSQAHTLWCEAMIADGWAWGPVKNVAVKTHPNLVAWADLPPMQRRKDEMSYGLTVLLIALCTP